MAHKLHVARCLHNKQSNHFTRVSFIFDAMKHLSSLLIVLVLSAGTAVAQKSFDKQYKQLIEKCHEYERIKDRTDLLYLQGEIMVVINKETPMPEVYAIFERAGLQVKGLYPVGSAQIAHVVVPIGEERKWIAQLKNYKPVACGYLNMLATPKEEIENSSDQPAE